MSEIGMPHGEALLCRLGLSTEVVLGLEALSHDSSVYVSGSLAEGLGNRFSDLDVFIIGTEQPRGGRTFRVSPYLEVAVHQHERVRIDYQYWRCERAWALAEQLDMLADGEAARFSERELEFMHRLRVGQHLTSPAAVAEVRNAFDYARLAAALLVRALEDVDDALEDIYGMLEERCLDTALERSRDLLSLCCCAYLHSRGSTNTKPKWRTKLLADVAANDALGREFQETYFRMQWPDASPRRTDMALRAHIEGCVRSANRLVQNLQG